MSAPPPRVGDRLRGPTGRVWHVVCRGETFLTFRCPDKGLPNRAYVPLREWPSSADAFTPLARLAR